MFLTARGSTLMNTVGGESVVLLRSYLQAPVIIVLDNDDDLLALQVK